MNATIATALILCGTVIIWCLRKPEYRSLGIVLLLGVIAGLCLFNWRLIITGIVVASLVFVALAVLLGMMDPWRAVVRCTVALFIAFVMTAVAVRIGAWLLDNISRADFAASCGQLSRPLLQNHEDVPPVSPCRALAAASLPELRQRPHQPIGCLHVLPEVGAHRLSFREIDLSNHRSTLRDSADA